MSMTMFFRDYDNFKNIQNQVSQYRIHSAIVMLGIYLGQFQLRNTLFFIIAFEIIYFTFKYLFNKLKQNSEQMKLDEHNATLRKMALHHARIYLSPYRDIWKHLRLSNTYCYIRLGETPSEIIAGEKVHPHRNFTVITSHVHEYEDLWNMFCKEFGHDTTYQGLVEMCNRFKVSIKETIDNTTPQRADSELERSSNQFKPTQTNNSQQTVQKIDINNCSEIELTELPGINIIMAKKIIKKRDEINGFKSIQEFFEFTKLKPHFQTQLEKIIDIKKKIGNLSQIHYSERKLDL